jgi:hypothetical protein
MNANWRQIRRATKGMKPWSSVSSEIYKFCGSKDVTFIWFMARRTHPVAPYAEVIAGYNEHEDNIVSELTVDELFKLEEARALVQYLDTHYGEQGIQSMRPAELPVARNVIGVGGIPYGGPQGRIYLQDSNYPLPFEVQGYFDLRGTSVIPGCENERRRQFNSNLIGFPVDYDHPEDR